MTKTDYWERLKDPRWQRKRLEILERDEWTCQVCGEKEKPLHIHHKYYLPVTNPWDYQDDCLVTVCEECHENETKRRKDIDKLCLRALRTRFWGNDMIDIAEGIHGVEMVHLPEVVSTSIRWALRNQDFMQLMVKTYLDTLEKTE